MGADRRRHDPSAAAGVPAHITLLYPFFEPDRIDQALDRHLRGFFSSVEAFDFELAGTAWFGDAVLYLAPIPSEAFVRLTEALAGAFGLLPYAGAYGQVVPHVTVTQGIGSGDAAAIEVRLRQALPLACRAEMVLLMAGSAELPWRRLASYPLA